MSGRLEKWPLFPTFELTVFADTENSPDATAPRFSLKAYL
jgi:hypothetical protein